MRPNHPGFDNDLDLSSVLKHLNSTSLLRSCGTPNVHWVSDAHPRAHRRLTEKAKEGFRFKDLVSMMDFFGRTSFSCFFWFHAFQLPESALQIRALLHRFAA